MKKTLIIITILLASITLVGCSSSEDSEGGILQNPLDSITGGNEDGEEESSEESDDDDDDEED